MMYMMTPEQHAQIVDAMHIDATEARLDEALEMLKTMQPVKATAWYELNADMNAWFLAYGHNPRATTRALYTPTKD